MSQESKNLKICCFVTIALGVVAAIVGIAGLAGGTDGRGGALAVCSGVAGVVLGLWAARAANVPTNAAGIMRASLVGALACLALGVASYLLGTANGNVAPLVAIVGPCAGSCGVYLLARRVEKSLR